MRPLLETTTLHVWLTAPFPHVSMNLTTAEPSFRSPTDVWQDPGTKCEVTPPAGILQGIEAGLLGTMLNSPVGSFAS